MKDKIDFVVTWVDDSDSNWQSKRNQYSNVKSKSNVAKTTFREWGAFRYWFRGVEKMLLG